MFRFCYHRGNTKQIRLIPLSGQSYILVLLTTKAATLKKTKHCFSRPIISLNAGQTYCRMLQGEHSAILSTFIKLPIITQIFVLSIFEWPLKTGFTVYVLEDKSIIMVLCNRSLNLFLLSMLSEIRQDLLRVPQIPYIILY